MRGSSRLLPVVVTPSCAAALFPGGDHKIRDIRPEIPDRPQFLDVDGPHSLTSLPITDLVSRFRQARAAERDPAERKGKHVGEAGLEIIF